MTKPVTAKRRSLAMSHSGTVIGLDQGSADRVAGAMATSPSGFVASERSARPGEPINAGIVGLFGEPERVLQNVVVPALQLVSLLAGLDMNAVGLLQVEHRLGNRAYVVRAFAEPLAVDGDLRLVP